MGRIGNNTPARPVVKGRNQPIVLSASRTCLGRGGFGVVVLDGVGAAMGDEPLADCEGCRAARTIEDTSIEPPRSMASFCVPRVSVFNPRVREGNLRCVAIGKTQTARAREQCVSEPRSCLGHA